MKTQTDRRIPPKLVRPEQITTPQPVHHRLDNGINLYYLVCGTEAITRVDFSFDAGTKFQRQPFSAMACNSLLLDGSTSISGKKIAELTDYYGAYLHPFANRDEAGLQLYTLDKFFKKCFGLALDVLKNPRFPKKELEIFRQKKLQSLQLDAKKVEVVSRKQFMAVLFGKDHPYGFLANVSQLGELKQNHLIDFHIKHYIPESLSLIITGPNVLAHRSHIEETLGHIYLGSSMAKANILIPDVEAHPSDQKQHYYPINEAVQTSIRIGKIIPSSKHPDYYEIMFVNTVLGGYFGSRLMKSLRENLGYTYGIHSALVSLKASSFQMISSNVKADVSQLALQECYRVVNDLTVQLMDQNEFNTVRNYLLGDLQRQLDGPFNIADVYKSLSFSGLNFDFIHQFRSVLEQTDPNRIRQVASKYFGGNDFIEVSAGPEK